MPSQPVHDQSYQAVSRIGYIDFLKVIGLAGIVAAHTGPPGWVIMLRCFDVPLMVILSAMLGERAYSRRLEAGKPLQGYYLCRVKRLVFPTWVFLAFYFLIRFLAGGEARSFRYYAASFLLTQYGIKYVWVILIYLYSALMIPFFCRFGQMRWIWAGVAAAYALYELAYHLKIGTDSKLLMSTFYDFVPYAIGLTYLGVSANRLSRQKHLWVAAGALAVFTGMAVYYHLTQGSFQSVQNAKYPARLYYLSYGVGCSFALLAFCETVRLRLYESRLVRFISSHSLWLYLWHILVLDVYSVLRFPENWVLKWLTVFTASVLIVYLINLGLDAVEKRKRLKWLWVLRG